MTTEVEQELFTPSSVQKELFWDDRPTLVFIAGRGSGKSTAACLRILGMLERGELQGGERIMICGPDYTQLMDGTVKTFDYWFGIVHNYIIHRVDGNKPRRVLRAIDGGQIEVLCRSGMNPEQTRSKECRLIWLDEAAQMPLEMIELANMNLRPTGIRPKNDPRVFQLIITTTPKGKNFLYRLYGKYLMDHANEDTSVGAWRMTTLQALKEGVATEAYINRIVYAPGSQKWKEEVEGEFVSYSGLVFSQNWKKLDYKPKLRYVVGGVDVGSVSPSCILLVGMDEPGNVYALKEFYKPRAEMHELAEKIGEWHKEFGVNRWVIDDPDLWRTLRNGGLPTAPPNKKLDAASAMVNHINSLTARGQFFIDEDACPALVKEMQTYEYKDMQSGDEVTFLDKVKGNQSDHALDALRYAVRVLSSVPAMQSYGKSLEFAYA